MLGMSLSGGRLRADQRMLFTSRMVRSRSGVVSEECWSWVILFRQCDLGLDIEIQTVERIYRLVKGRE